MKYPIAYRKNDLGRGLISCIRIHRSTYSCYYIMSNITSVWHWFENMTEVRIKFGNSGKLTTKLYDKRVDSIPQLLNSYCWASAFIFSLNVTTILAERSFFIVNCLLCLFYILCNGFSYIQRVMQASQCLCVQAVYVSYIYGLKLAFKALKTPQCHISDGIVPSYNVPSCQAQQD